MEGLSHQRLLRRQLSESLDLNESLAARIEQLKAYIWRAGLEVPRPEDGVHGPIVERSEASLHAPTKRLRTESPRFEHNDGVSLATIEASLDRSVREALVRMRSDESQVAVSPGKSLSQIDSRAQHVESSVESLSGPARSSNNPSVNHSSSVARKTVIDSDTSNLGYSTRNRVTAAHKQDAKSPIQTRSWETSTSTAQDLAHNNDHTSLSAVDEASAYANEPTSLTSKPISSDYNEQPEQGSLADSSDMSALPRKLRTEVSSSGASFENMHDSYGKRERTLDPRATERTNIATNTETSDANHQTVSRTENEPDTLETSNVSEAHAQDEADIELSEDGRTPYEMEAEYVRENNTEEPISHSEAFETSRAHNSPDRAEQAVYERRASDGADEAKRTRNISQTDDNRRSSESEYEADRRTSSPRGAETASLANSVPESAPKEADTTSTNIRQPDLATANTEYLRDDEVQEREASHQQSPSSHRSSPAQPITTVENSPPAKQGTTLRAGNWGNESFPLTSTAGEIAMPVGPNSETRIPRRERSDIRDDIPPLPAPAIRKPRDDWAMQFRESFNLRKAQNALQRAGLSTNPDLTAAMQRLAESEKLEEHLQRKHPMGNTSLRSTPDSAENRRTSSGSASATEPQANSNSAPISSKGQNSDLSKSISDATITPARVSRGVRDGRNTSVSPSSSAGSSQRRDSFRKEGREASPVERQAKSLPAKGSPPAPPRSVSTIPLSQQDAPPMPPVPQSILRRLSRPPSSIVETGLGSHNESLSSPFHGSVRPPMTSTPGPKARLLQRSEQGERSPVGDARERISLKRSKTSPNSSVYQSALQSFDTSQSSRLQDSDWHQRSNEPQARQDRDFEASGAPTRQGADYAKPFMQQMQSLNENSADSNIPQKPEHRDTPGSASPRAANNGRTASMKSMAQTRTSQKTANGSLVEDRRVSFKLPSSTSDIQEPIEPQLPRPQSRRKLVRNVYPVDLSNTSQASLPDMSMQAASDVGEISERRERPPL